MSKCNVLLLMGCWARKRTLGEKMKENGMVWTFATNKVSVGSVGFPGVCVHAPVHVLSCLRLFATPWTAVHQAPLSMEFSRQEYWSKLPFPTLGDLPDPGIKLVSLPTPVLAGQFFTTEPPGNLSANAGDAGSIPGLGRPPGEGNGYLL